MATLDTLVYQFQRTLSFEVRINGVVLSPNSPLSDGGVPAISSISISKSLDNPVPVCQVELSHLPTWITRGMTATVDLGYNNIMQRVFTGFVQDRSRKVAGCTLRCLGSSYSLHRTIQITDRDVTNQTVYQSIVSILQYCGISNYFVGVGSYTMGTSGNTIKMEKMPASQMVQMLADIDGSRIYETNAGEVIVTPFEEIPATTAFAAYKSTDQTKAIVLDGSDREDPEYFRDQVIVTGATLQAVGNTDSSTLTSTATLAATGGFIQPPLPNGSHIQMEYSNSLIDTQAKLDTLALLLLNRFGRVPRYLTIDVAGDPRLDMTQTIELNLPEAGIGDSFWFIHGIEHHIDATGGYRTQLSLRGGDQIGGVANLNPVASFTAVSEQEVMGGVVKTVVMFDASTSYDPDGSIVTYAWTSNQPVSIANGKQVTVAVDTTGWTGDWTVTLTVTDNSGNTASSTQTIPYGSTPVTFIPAMYVAMSNNFSATPDGGVKWNDQTNASSTVISVGARPANGQNVGYACYGRSDGTIYRTTNGLATAPTQVASGLGSAVNDIQWDWRFPDTVWAITENCKLWKSADYGATWTLAIDFRTLTYAVGTATPNALGNGIGLPGAGGIYIGGGTGDGYPLIAYDPNFSGNWVHQTFTGDLATDLATPADATMRIVSATAPGDGHSTIMLSWTSGGGANLTAIYDSASDPGPSAAYTRATGLTAGLKAGHLILGEISQLRYAFFNDQDVWYSTDCVAYTRRASVLPAGVTANHGMMLSDNLTGYPTVLGCGVLACQNAGKTLGIYKSVDGFQTVVAVRPVTGYAAWPSNGMGMKIALGAPSVTTIVPGAGKLMAIFRGGNPKQSTILTGSVWSSLVSVTGVTDSDPVPFCLTTTNWFVVDGYGSGGAYTKDGGSTWLSLPSALNLVCWFARDAGGRILALTDDISNVASSLYYSDDQGDTWTLLKNWPSPTREVAMIACHPSNQNIYVALGINGSINGLSFVSTDRGATWTEYAATPNTGIVSHGNFQWIEMKYLSTGRIVASGNLAQSGGIAGWRVYVSDNNGQTWTMAYTDGNSSTINWYGLCPNFSGNKIVIARISTATTPYVVTFIVSNDFGSTWSVVTPTSDYETFVGSTTGSITALAYDPYNDIAYLNGNPNNSHVIQSFNPVAAGGAWAELKNNLGSLASGFKNLQVIP